MDEITMLKLRRDVCLQFIKIIEESNDPRKVSALNEYKKQLEIAEKNIKDYETNPPPVVVGLKPATISGSTPK